MRYMLESRFGGGQKAGPPLTDHPATGYPMIPPKAQASFRSVARRPKVGNLTVSCPMLVSAMGPGEGFVALPLTRLAAEVQCQISVAFVKTTLDAYLPQTWRAGSLQLYVPKTTSTVVSEVVVENLNRDKIFVTAIVPADDVQKGGYKPSTVYGPSGQPQNSETANDPELFCLPLGPPGACQPADRLRVTITTFEPLTFEEGHYVMRLPTEIPYSMIPEGYSHTQLLDVIVTINTGNPTTVKYGVRSGHRAVPGVQSPGTVTLSLDKSPDMPNTDVDVRYLVWGSDMFLALNVTPPRAPGPADPDPRGAFVLTLAPPAPEHTTPFPRSIIFILDRSGSMMGEPLSYAKWVREGSALSYGLRLLTPLDQFTVVAFDHEQLWFTPGGQLLPGTAQNVAACESWIHSSISARGLTDIRGPLQTAMGVLTAAAGAAAGGQYPQQQQGGEQHQQGAAAVGTPRPLPFIFLVTDGCVTDEKDICRYVEQHLATYGRGSFDVAFRPHAIQAQMQNMLTAAQRPVLSDLTLTLPGVEQCELYPFPLPDLFCGMPLLVAGKFRGAWPPLRPLDQGQQDQGQGGGVCVNGMLPNGTAWSSNPVYPGKESDLPLDKIFIKNRLDLLTAQAWLEGNPPQLVNNIVDLSIATGVPCAHTRTVTFETTRKDFAALQHAANTGGRRKINYAKYAIGGAAGLVVLAGLGVGAAFAFGDVGATAANAGAYDPAPVSSILLLRL
ncbi:hypothetical protein VOLCADRAFT_104477 [Volvox carteri f. nagariensis]|uniref:VWFA domain-containing protein n=1 Tax=Volvox carteri f. nagariensis TaxID=3068 RepID=D8TTU8_VOLCA|nr:uncharacterized protein VOLCADRAFT_104477 [Volvox carteri f. nagariensis]EFJ49032.1 hypothetical protein VOLCADRAFT_104477 [Volvox carteri f. nagariensis]|eukprot:XP_002949929.1 hypothetical protein VOLCADRAFT_104477 [Volvox carteri f. nagariensis]